MLRTPLLHDILRDPRHAQIAILSTLAAYGLTVLDLDVSPAVAATLLVTALASQWILTRLVGLPRFDVRSPLISALSLILLLRTRSIPLAAVAALLTIGSKFAIRSGEGKTSKHVYNPTNFGLAAALLLFDGVWISSGQWGSGAFLAFAAACLGVVVVHRAERSDVTWAFLFAWGAVLFGRAAWLGDPWEIPLHQVQSGAFLIFAFFMISDPKTTPDSRAGRIVFACAVAAVASWIQFGLHRPNALIWALFWSAPVVPLADRVLPGLRYHWPGTSRPSRGSSLGDFSQSVRPSVATLLLRFLRL